MECHFTVDSTRMRSVRTLETITHNTVTNNLHIKERRLISSAMLPKTIDRNLGRQGTDHEHYQDIHAGHALHVYSLRFSERVRTAD